MKLESTLNVVNRIYQTRNIAIINKRATPMKIIGQTRGHQHICIFDKKSTVDYDGVYLGRAIFFDAKSVQTKTRFDLKNIEQHQYDYLSTVEKHGGIAFLLIGFEGSGELFFCSMSMIRHYWNEAKGGGRKSIPREAFEYEAMLVKDTGRAPMDYLACVDQMIESIRERPGMLAE
ncbi:Holliday junction resolvase RecU [Candidatus Saccharibacteria bacterium]|uniref:Holliday junction resolvase RecU n=1 Tax=Heyndrickxia TaxID=2837504 RepID=UPI002E1BB057|nr:Holliday junction resolvase RecU [Candidatus Saccharibacteria bacterium]MED4922101.1 Holliday junction resolvase RecU [Weizmannia sp. CD-2023]MED4977202.1 Holliday junction resolvase RecU [Weizmannia sp. CD-2023]